MGNRTPHPGAGGSSGAGGLAQQEPTTFQSHCHRESDHGAARPTIKSCSAQGRGCLGAEKIPGPDGRCWAGPRGDLPAGGTGSPSCPSRHLPWQDMLATTLDESLWGTALTWPSWGGTHPDSGPESPHLERCTLGGTRGMGLLMSACKDHTKQGTFVWLQALLQQMAVPGPPFPLPTEQLHV